MLEVALTGNPNTGKTTLFNALTGSRAHVGNYPGITIEHRDGVHVAGNGTQWRVHDLPGCYSLTAHSPEEEIAHHALTGRLDEPEFDVVVVVLDAANLSRNLLLLLQIAELGKPVVAALNMMDAARASGLEINLLALRAALHCPFVPLIARTGEGIRALEDAVHAVAADAALGRVPETVWPSEVREAMRVAEPILHSVGITWDSAAGTPQNPEILWWIAADPEVADRILPGLGAQLLQALPRAADPQRDVRRAMTVARYRRIDEILTRAVRRIANPPESMSDRIDRVVLHPAGGALLFCIAMAILFQAVFLWAQPAIDVVNSMMSFVSDAMRAHLPDNLLRDVLIDGVLAGVGGTLVFLPQILMLFLGIALLEDTGYLARTAFLVDRVMARVGLPGKAFVPLLSSFACAVPGIMATRTMGDRRDRLLTILVAPLMSCSARLPVYTLVTAAVFAGSAPVFGFLSLGGLIVAAMYLLGFVLALLSAFVMRRTVVRGGGAPLMLEMPPYRWPKPRNIARALWDRARVFLVQTGSVIVGLTVVLWALMTFPRMGLEPVERARLEAVAEKQTAAGTPERKQAMTNIDRQDERLRLEQSVAGRMGKLIEPLIAPLGFDWRIGIGLIGSFAAREVLVPIMGQVYGRGSQADIDDRYAGDVGQTMANAGSLTPLRGVSLMVFFAIAMQCLSTVATVRRETGNWRWPVLAIVYLNSLAWIVSMAVYQGGRALGWS